MGGTGSHVKVAMYQSEWVEVAQIVTGRDRVADKRMIVGVWHCRSVRTDDGEEMHVLVSPVRSQGGDDSPSSPSRLPDSVLKAMCNMGKAFLSRSARTYIIVLSILDRTKGELVLRPCVHASCSILGTM